MKALIIPKASVDGLKPLTNWVPEYLLPVANKPVGEHLVEWLVRHGIKEIFMILKHLPFETEQYFGDGARWGVRISYFLQRHYDSLADVVKRLGSRVTGPVFCVPGNVVTNLDLSHFVEVQREFHGDITVARPGSGDISNPVRPGIGEDWQEFDGLPCILTQEALSILSQHEPRARQNHSPPVEEIRNITFHVFEAPFTLHAITTPNDYLEANLHALHGEFEGLVLPGKLVSPGIHVGRRTKIDPGAVLTPPVLVGDHCNIGKGCNIGEGAVICDRVIMDENVSVRHSVVLSHTYLGPYADIGKAVVKKNCLVQTPSLQEIWMGDDLILGDLSKGTLSGRMERFWNVLLALFFMLVSSPVMAFLCLVHLAFPSREYLKSHRRYGGATQRDLDGRLVWKAFDLYSFQSENRIFQKLPGLFNVLKGDLNLVGVSPLTREEIDEMLEEWRQMRANAPAGLFRPWEAETPRDLEWEEKMVMETYYASTRSFRVDLIILALSLFRGKKG